MKKILFLLITIVISNFAIAKGREKIVLEDTVYKIKSSANSEMIFFDHHAGIYHLRHDSKDFNSIKAALIRSQETAKPVRFKADADYLEIDEILD